jgi:hypothetical protein
MMELNKSCAVIAEKIGNPKGARTKDVGEHPDLMIIRSNGKALCPV